MIKKVMIAGGGTLGSQIAWQCAISGFNVVVYDAFEKGIKTSISYHKKFGELFVSERGLSLAEKTKVEERISYSTNLAEAIKDIDLVSESIPEDLEIKRAFYKEISKLAPKKTIFTTNSSSTIPSDYAYYTDRPKRFLALHFANGIWDANIGEVMGHGGTNGKIFDQVVQFAKDIGMVPIPIKKEQNGYVFNSLLIPWLRASVDLLVNEVSDIESIDKAWMIGTNAPIGPLAILDMIGMQTTYNVDILWGEKLGDQSAIDRANYIKKNFIDRGKMGRASGEGFYKYPNASFLREDFLD